jgi:hypothetical protein
MVFRRVGKGQARKDMIEMFDENMKYGKETDV